MSVILLGHTLSRLNATTVILVYQYARDDGTSKTKPLAKELTLANYMVAFFIGIMPLIIISFIWSFYISFIILPLILLIVYLGYYFKKWIGGFTGDCLGTVQRLSEILIYVYMVAIWKFI